MRFVRMADSKQPCMHLLKFYILQHDQTLKEYLSKVEFIYAVISQHTHDILGNTTCYEICNGIELEPPSPPKKVPWMKPSIKNYNSKVEEDDLSKFGYDTDDDVEEEETNPKE